MRLSAPRTPQIRSEIRLFGAALVMPVRQLAEVPPWGWLVACCGGLLTFLTSDVIIVGIGLVMLAGMVDYLVGYALARTQGRFDPSLARAGLVIKAASVAVILIVRIVEWWAHAFGLLPDTRGLAAGAVAFAFVTNELRSIAGHGVRIPLLSAILDRLDGLVLDRAAPTPTDRARTELER